MTIPIWVYAVVVGIVISALMAIKTGREERMLEMENIEKEGEIYLTRLEQEKERREGERATAQQNTKRRDSTRVPSLWLSYCAAEVAGSSALSKSLSLIFTFASSISVCITSLIFSFVNFEDFNSFSI